MNAFPIHITSRGHAALRLFGMNGAGVSFDCDHCGERRENRLPVRSGNDESQFFCSFACARGLTREQFRVIRNGD